MPSAPSVRALLLAYAGFIVYGSLVPLDFHFVPLFDAWQRFRGMPFLHLGVESRADWIANGVLYAPLGFLAAWWRLRGDAWRVTALAVAVILGVVLAVGVEFTQVFFPPRTVSMNDLMAESIGSVFGALLALAVWRRGVARPAMQHTAARWLAAHGLQTYAATYLAYRLFPYDVLISWVEIEQKLASDHFGWWLAGEHRRPLIVALRLGIEVLLAMPLGLLLGQRAAGRRAPGWVQAALVGLAVGLGIEGAQVMLYTGVTQGASVLTRVLGVVAGLALWRQRERWSREGLRAALGRASGVCAPAYALLLAGVTGWFALDWQGMEAASARWQELRFVPFYYHYYTTEAHALTSLVNVSLMYLPVGVLAWARRRSAGVAALWGAASCAVFEASKLWLVGLHPDPTNVGIAAAICWSFVQVVDGWSRPSLAPFDALAVGARLRAERTRLPPPRGAASTATLLGMALLPALLYFATGPAAAAVSAVLLVACGAAVWLRPLTAALIVPALLPALDLAPWTGRFFLDEFDLLLLVCLALGWLRSPPARKHTVGGSGPWRPAFALLALSFAISTASGAMPWPWPDPNSFASYYSAYNALRIAKGVLWAGLFVSLLRRLDQSGHDTGRALASGMALGLIFVVGFVVWERLAFVGLFDFADEYRVSGPFSAMHRGGAFVECYIAVAMPFLALRVIETRRWFVRAAGAALLAATSYAMVVTFSRGGYAAFGAAFVMFFVLAIARGGATPRLAALLAAAMLAVAAMGLLSPFAQQRLAQWGRDLATRQAHWRDAFDIRDRGPMTAAFGMGVGRFPETHFWRSREAVHAASYGLQDDTGTRFLRLGGGTGRLYIDQIVSGDFPPSLMLTLRLRANQPASTFDLSVCEKWLLTSRTCVAATVRAGDTAGVWTRVETRLDLAALVQSRTPWARPVKLSLYTPAVGTVVDLADIALVTPEGREWLTNGDFRRDLDHWFFSTDADPPWHIHSLPVAVLFDQGWFGVAAWSTLLIMALGCGARQAWRGDRYAAAGFAALVAFLVVGSMNTLIDDPRFLFLLLLMSWLCCSQRRHWRGAAAGAAQKTGPAMGAA